MPVSAYVGRPRSGKSYGVWENVIIPALKSKREVWTNIPFDAELCLERFGCQPVFYDYQDVESNPAWFHDVLPKGVVFVADELWKIWPSGMNANKMPQSHRSFLAEHGHMVGQDGKVTEVILVCQDLGQVAAFVRNLVDTTYRSIKQDKVGFSKKFKVQMFDGPVTGPSPPQSKVISTSHYSYRREVYELYKSHTMSETGGAGDETKMDNRASFLKNKMVMLLPVYLALAVSAFYGFSYVYQSFFGVPESDIPAPTKVGQSKVVTVSQASQTSKMDILDVLQNRDLSIVSNRGRYPDIDYRIQAESGLDHFTLGRADMLKLGYKIRPISDCLVSIIVILRHIWPLVAAIKDGQSLTLI